MLESHLDLVDDAVLFVRDVLSSKLVELFLAGASNGLLFVLAGAVDVFEEGLVTALGL